MNRNSIAFISIIIILFFEGAARKWLSGSLTLPAILIRDFLCGYLIVFGYKEIFLKKDIVFLQLSFLTSFILVIFILIQTIFVHKSVIIALIGIRFWVVYPLAAIIAALSINHKDYKIVVRYLAYSLFILVPLALVQYNLPPSSFLNKQVEEEGYVFELVSGVVRVTGTFSFTLGYSIYMTFVLNLCYMVYLRNQYFNVTRFLSVVFLFLALMGCLISGSRAVAITTVFSLIFFVSALIFSKQNKNTFIVNLLILAILSISLVLVSNSQYVYNISERFVSASYSEDLSLRLSNMIFGESRFKLDPSLLGQGLGSGSNLTSQLTGKDGFYLGETETARSYNESGLSFMLIIAAKLYFALCGFYYSLKNIIVHRDFSIFILWFVAIQILFLWQLSAQLTVNGLGYLFLSIFALSIRYLDPARSYEKYHN